MREIGLQGIGAAGEEEREAEREGERERKGGGRDLLKVKVVNVHRWCS